MTIAIKHTHGVTEIHPDLDSAIAALREVYGDEIAIYGTDGFGLKPGDNAEWSFGHGRALVWQDEASSVDDDGARAVASVSLRLDR